MAAAVGLDGVDPQRKRDRQGQPRQQIDRRVQTDAQGACVERLDAERVRRRAARLHLGAVVDRIQQGGQRCGRGWFKGAAKAGRNLRGINGLAIAPTRIGAQGEGPFQPIGTALPGFRQSRDQGALRVFRDQALVQIAQHVGAGDLLAAMRVQR